MSEKSQPAAATERELLHSTQPGSLRPWVEPGVPFTALVPEIAPIFGAPSGATATADSNLVSQLMDLLPVLVSYVTPDLSYGWINSHYQHWFGRPRQDIVGRHIRDLLGDAAFDRALPYLRKALAGEVVRFDNAITSADGVGRHLEVTYVPRRGSDGTVLGLIVLAFDVSERRRAEDRERQLLADLAHVARLTTMGEMASGLAHELNQPLAAITGYVEAATRLLRAQGGVPPGVRQAMEGAAAEAERAGKIIHRMKNFLRRTEPHQSAIDLNLLIREALDLVDRDIRLSGARLQLDLADHLPPALADRIQIEQVMLNLVRNALEAMQQTPRQDRLLAVRTGRADTATVRASVLDTGCGLPADAATKLFLPFFTTKPSGMGMGLAISRTIVTAHGGRLEADPGPEGGAVFTFTLPVVASETGS